MARRRERDYKQEYARRIAKGLAEGKTRQQARGHAAERKGAVGASKKGLSQRQVAGYLSRLAERRTVSVIATMSDGSRKVLARGKPRAMERWFREEGGLEDQTDLYSGEIASIQVLYS